MTKPLDPFAEAKVRAEAEKALAYLGDLLTQRQDETTTIERRGQIMAFRRLIKWLDGEATSLAK